MGFGGHAMCVIGYDDRRVKYANGETYTGAFQIMNSWGPEWGVNGVAWVGYADFKRIRPGGLWHRPDAQKWRSRKRFLRLRHRVGKERRQTIHTPRLRSGNVFETVNKVAPGTRFKMEIKNSGGMLYLYLRTGNRRQQLYLFPIPARKRSGKTAFSPYCGITGYRLFPRKEFSAG